MTEHEVLDDSWATAAFDRARLSQNEPHWSPDAAQASRTSARRRVRTRITGAASVAAVFGISATAYATLGVGTRAGNQNAASATPAVKTTDTAAQNDKLGREIGKYFAMPIPGGVGAVPIEHTMAQDLENLATALDPSGQHLRAMGYEPVSIVSTPEPGFGVSIVGYWTPDGSTSAIYDKHTENDAYGAVDVSFAGAAPHTVNGPCGMWANGLDPEMNVAWSACVTHPLSGGSYVLSAHSTNLGRAQLVMATRVFRDGSRITVSATNTLVYDRPNDDHLTVLMAPTSPGYFFGKSVEPAPWTEQTVTAALSSDGIKRAPLYKGTGYGPLTGSGSPEVKIGH
jgi:hypothetical protein